MTPMLETALTTFVKECTKLVRAALEAIEEEKARKAAARGK